MFNFRRKSEKKPQTVGWTSPALGCGQRWERRHGDFQETEIVVITDIFRADNSNVLLLEMKRLIFDREGRLSAVQRIPGRCIIPHEMQRRVLEVSNPSEQGTGEAPK